MTTKKTGEREGREVLRSQRQTGSAKPQAVPAPTPKPTQNETIMLASGERRTVEIETTNDPEWNDLVTLTEGKIALTLDQKDMTHRTMAAIAKLRVAHKDDWKAYCLHRKMKWPKEVKSDFRPVAMWVLNKMKEKSGENHTSKASMIAGCLDEIWQYEMAGIDSETGEKVAPLALDNIAAWLTKNGGYTTVYGRRRDRRKESADKQEDRYNKFLGLPPLEDWDAPKWASGFSGEVLIAANLDAETGRLKPRSILQPKGRSFWYSRLDQLIAARPVEPVRKTEPEPTVDRETDQHAARPDTGATGPSAEATTDAKDATEGEADKPLPETAANPAAVAPTGTALDPVSWIDESRYPF